jgi:hypothetical protein
MNEPGEHLNKHPHFQQGVDYERKRIIALLRDKEVLRDSMFLPEGWSVIYTQFGAIDIRNTELTGENE